MLLTTFLNNLSAKLNEIKYTLIRKFLNFPVNRKIKRGFIIIQIDGLAYSTFCYALEKRYMPKLKKYILKESILKKLYTRIPSNTPNFQKILFYGDETKIPGFRWLEKENKKYFSFKIPETAENIEKKIKSGGYKGILKTGVSYYNLFSGDAERSYLTLSTILNSKLSKRITGFKIFLIISLNFGILIKVIFNSLKEIIQEIIDFLYFYINELSQRNFIFFPFLRLINNVVIHEYITGAVLMEIICGTPKIYVTFNSYDELSHHRGPYSRSTLKSLKRIDKSIFKIWLLAKKSKIRKYDFFIVSDHGQSYSYPFVKFFRKELKDIFIRYKENFKIAELSSITHSRESSTLRILQKIKKMSETGELPTFISKLFPLARIDKKKRYKIFETFNERNINIICSGPIAHIYFNDYKKRLTFDEINNIFPYLLIDILSHKGIESILLIEKKDIVILLLKKGFCKIKDGKVIQKSGVFPNDYNDFILKELYELALLKNSGDLILLSSKTKDFKVNFEEQMSCHGGIDKEQNEIFFIFPEYRKKFFVKNLTLKMLYKYFYNFYNIE